jgi:hypothetical protein
MIFVLLFSNCSVVNKGYVPTYYEPIFLNENCKSKLSLQNSSSYIKAQYAHAINAKFALALNETYGFGTVSNTELLGVYYKNKNRFTYEIGVGTGLQDNNIRYNGTAEYIIGNILPGSKYYTERINATYQTGFICGSIFTGDYTKTGKIGLTYKVGVGYIYNYNYSLYTEPYEGKENYPLPIDQEQLKFKGGWFNMDEIAVVYKLKMGGGGFRAQLGYTYCSPAVLHNYYFEQQQPQIAIVSGHKNHPTYNMVTFTIGFNIAIIKKH